MRNKLSGERDGDEEVEMYSHRPDSLCAALKNNDSGQAVVPKI